MRFIKHFLLSCGVLALCSSVAIAESDFYKNCRYHGAWQTCENNINGNTVPVMIILNSKGARLTIDVHYPDLLSLNFDSNVKNKEKYSEKKSLINDEAEIFIDKDFQKNVKVMHFYNDRHLGFYGLKMSEDLVEECKKGKKLTIVFRDMNFIFSLSGFSAALKRAQKINSEIHEDYSPYL